MITSAGAIYNEITPITPNSWGCSTARSIDHLGEDLPSLSPISSYHEGRFELPLPAATYRAGQSCAVCRSRRETEALLISSLSDHRRSAPAPDITDVSELGDHGSPLNNYAKRLCCC